MSEIEMNNFIKTIMENDLKSGKHTEIITRFPPEPNAYLHIGHARAMVTNFALAKMFNGKTNLRFDDTNPAKEDASFVDAIINDIEWLGFKPDNVFFGSDYFEKTYEKAILLIKKSLAYVCDLTFEETSQYRGTLSAPGKNSPFRERSVEENLEMFTNMRNGVYKAGEKVLRAKIDMSSPNINMRDPVIYRILDIPHHNTKDEWVIYPMYDFAHPLQDAFEGITHSLCSLEYDNHRPLYDWVVAHCDTVHTPRQIEFGRLSITHTIMSKRYLKLLVESKLVIGYDDPRMPTLVGLRRRGYTKDAIINFIVETGLSRTNATVERDMLEHFLREDLKLKTNRIMGVKDPLKVTITNYPEGEVEYLEVQNNNEEESLGSRQVAFSKHLYIEKEDFLLEKPNKHFKRLALGIEVRLFGAYFIKCTDVVRDATGEIIELLCTYDEATKSNSGFNERKPNGTIHYCEATTAKRANFNIFDSLLNETAEDEEALDIIKRFNKDSWKVMEGFIENQEYKTEDKFQLIRDGYYAVDKTSTADVVVLNQTVSLKSSFK